MHIRQKRIVVQYTLKQVQVNALTERVAKMEERMERSERLLAPISEEQKRNEEERRSMKSRLETLEKQQELRESK